MPIRCTVKKKNVTEPLLIGHELIEKVTHDSPNLRDKSGESHYKQYKSNAMYMLRR
jgi:hypothetical protein